MLSSDFLDLLLENLILLLKIVSLKSLYLESQHFDVLLKILYRFIFDLTLNLSLG